jgi:hypothetical protein
MTAVRSTFLRTVIALDAAACGVMGAAFAFDAAWLAAPLGLSPGLMQPVGLFLVGYAALLAWLASRPALPRPVVWTLVAFNVAWAAESREDVDQLHALLLGIGATILDAPADYPKYGAGYYAVFFADPDGLKLEYVFKP